MSDLHPKALEALVARMATERDELKAAAGAAHGAARELKAATKEAKEFRDAFQDDISGLIEQAVERHANRILESLKAHQTAVLRAAVQEFLRTLNNA